MKKGKLLLIIIIGIIIYYSFNFYLKPISENTLITQEYKDSNSYVNDLYKSEEYFKTKLLNKNDYYIYETIMKSSINDTYNVSIPCKSDCVNKFNTSYNALMLDHPELISFQGFGSYEVKNNNITYNNYANLSKIKSSLGAKRIAREIDKIKKETLNMNDKDKIIYVYNYIAKHNYDMIFMYSRSNQSAYSFFTKGKSVCAGFAKASQLIFQNIGINSYLVMSNDHMWNYVEYNGKYYIFDATYGASFRDKKSIYYYDGLGKTTTNVTYGLYKELYPIIENTKLKDLFNLK